MVHRRTVDVVLDDGANVASGNWGGEPGNGDEGAGGVEGGGFIMNMDIRIHFGLIYPSYTWIMLKCKFLPIMTVTYKY